MKECLKRELEKFKDADKYIEKTPENNKRRFECLLNVFSQAYEEVTIDTLTCLDHWERTIIFTVDNGRRGKSFTVHYDRMMDVAFCARMIFNDAINILKLETCANCKYGVTATMPPTCRDCDINIHSLWEPKEEPKKVYTTTGWDRHNHPWLGEYIDTDVASMYPKFEYKHKTDTLDALRYSFGLSSQNHIPGIRDVIFNDPATIIFWADGTKTVVRCQDGEAYDPEKGLAMAISKKALGNTREYYHTFLHELKKVKKNSESVKMLEIGKSIRNGIAKGIADYLEYQGVLPKEKEDK